MNQISLNPSTIARILGLVACLLVFASIGGQISKFVLGHDHVKGLVTLFHLDSERNIPTYFSALLMIFTALLLALIAVLNRKKRLPHVSKWVILSSGFLFMAYDETFQIHERLVSPVRTMLGDNNLGAFYFAWVIPGIVLVLILGVYFMRFILHLPATARFRFLMAATIYLGGAIGIELIGGHYAELNGVQNLNYSLITTVEESLEMAGLIFFIWSLLNYCSDNYKEVRFRFGA